MDVDRDKILQTIEQVGQIIYGKEEEIREVMLAFMADGHILLEDIPGVGKTTMTLAFSKSMGLDYRRIQFTPDVLPPFLVIATQNPLGSAGTQSLPEAQIDRFMVSLSIGYPDYKSELQMAMGIGYQESWTIFRPYWTRIRCCAFKRRSAIFIYRKTYMNIWFVWCGPPENIPI